MAIKATGSTVYHDYIKPGWQRINRFFGHRKVRVLSEEEVPEKPLGHLSLNEVSGSTTLQSATPVDVEPLIPRPHDPPEKSFKAPAPSPVNITRFTADLDNLSKKVQSNLFPNTTEIQAATQLLDSASSKDWASVHAHLVQLSESWQGDITRLIHTAAKLADPEAMKEKSPRPIADFIPPPASMTEEEIDKAFDELVLSRNPPASTESLTTSPEEPLEEPVTTPSTVSQAEPLAESEKEPQEELQTNPPAEPQTEPLTEPEKAPEAELQVEALIEQEPIEKQAAPVEPDLIDLFSTDVEPPLSAVTVRTTTGQSISLTGLPAETTFGELIAERVWSQDLKLSNLPSCVVAGEKIRAEEKLHTHLGAGDLSVTLEPLSEEHQTQLKDSISKLLPSGSNSFIPAGTDSTDSLDWAVLSVYQQAKHDPAALNPETVKNLQQVLTGASHSLGLLPPNERQLAGQYISRLQFLLNKPVGAAERMVEKNAGKRSSVTGLKPQQQSSRAMKLLYNQSRPLVKEFLPGGRLHQHFIDTHPDGFSFSLLPESKIAKVFEDEISLYHKHFDKPLSLKELGRIYERCAIACIDRDRSADYTIQFQENLLNPDRKWQAAESPYKMVNSDRGIAFHTSGFKKYETPGKVNANTSDSFRLNVHPEDMEQAWPVISRILTRSDCPFISWEVQLPDPANAGDTMHDHRRFGGQFTLQSLSKSWKSRFSDRNIARCLLEINQALAKKRIRPGIALESDIPLSGIPYAGYRHKLDREGKSYEPADAVDEIRKLEYQNQARYRAVSRYLTTTSGS